MANAQKGDVTFEADGKTYTLRYSIDALCQLEDAVNMGVVEILTGFADLHKVRIGLARAALWAGLLEHHPDITLKQAGELILSAGGLQAAMQKVNEAFVAAFPEAQAKAKARPRKAAGTGSTS